MARIVFVGAERVGKACLELLLRSKKEVVAVFTAHDSQRERIADFVLFDDLAEEFQVPLHKVKSTKDMQVVQSIKSFNPDLIVMISWSQILPKEVVQCPPLGCLNIHYSLLPKRRGGAPLFWTIYDGLEKSGITLHYVDEGIDSGDIVGQVEFEISPSDTCGTLLDKIVKLAPRLLEEYLDSIERGDAPRRKQDESEVTHTPRRKPEESEINWEMSDEQLWRFIRALAPPYPSAFMLVGSRKLVFTNAKKEAGKLTFSGYLERT